MFNYLNELNPQQREAVLHLDGPLMIIAGAGSGLFVQAHSGNVGLNYILDEIDSMEKSEFGTKVYTDYEDRFQYFIGISMLLLVFEVLLHDKKNKWLNNKTLFGTK